LAKQQYENIGLIVVGAFIILYYLYKYNKENAVVANASFIIKDCGD